jgi:hypothetical protein
MGTFEGFPFNTIGLIVLLHCGQVIITNGVESGDFHPQLHVTKKAAFFFTASPAIKATSLSAIKLSLSLHRAFIHFTQFSVLHIQREHGCGVLSDRGLDQMLDRIPES